MSDERESKIVVVGAGLMGHGIAHVFASSGSPTVLVDINDEALSVARLKIQEILAGAVKLGKMDEAAADATLGRLSVSTNLAAACKDAELCIETASETLSVKLDIMRMIDSALPVQAMIGTNTSALSVTEIAGAVADPGRVIGMHFFNPVHKMKLLELVTGLATSPETVKRARAHAARIGKTTILVSDSPGFTTSRMSALLGNEAMWMLSESVASAEDIDAALRIGFNHPMGPLELGDLTGWDTRLKVLQYLRSMFGEKFRPCPLILKMVNSGRLGRKSGAGVYRYDAQGNKIAGSALRVSSL